MKKLTFIKKMNGRHWVGDGFPVRNIFSYTDIAAEISPFLMLDYAGPAEFTPTENRRGVGEHPHRGFETVTIVYQGEVEHRDSSGAGGKIGPGDVQWMTAASGIVHEEFHGTEFGKKGGTFEVIQLWVNLPANDKNAPPGYQGITDDSIPRLELPKGAGHLRVIAGEYQGAKGPARTFTPINLWDVRVQGGQRVELQVPEGFTTCLFVLKGRIGVGESDEAKEAELAVFETRGDLLAFNALEDSTLLLMNGEPIHEPVVGYGPFVMNTRDEIQQAFVDYQSGKMGRVGGK